MFCDYIENVFLICEFDMNYDEFRLLTKSELMNNLCLFSLLYVFPINIFSWILFHVLLLHIKQINSIGWILS